MHLEIVQDMSFEEFILAFRKFISQRGVPNAIISDYALQFKTASAAIDLLWNKVLKCEDVLNYMDEKRIRWHFIVERASWYHGEFYERLAGLLPHLTKLRNNVVTSLKRSVANILSLGVKPCIRLHHPYT
jgi:hypothetical protein